MRKLGILALIAILMAGMVYGAADCEFTTTATTAGTSATYLRGTSVNVSVNITGREDLPYNISTAVLSVNTGTISGTIVNNATNLSNYDDVNVTLNTQALADDQTYTLTMTLKNRTQQTEGTCTLSIITDNAVPGCTFSQTTGSEYAPTQTFTVACTNTSSAEIRFSGDMGYAMTEISDTCTYTGDIPEGRYTRFEATTYDGLNSSICTIENIVIDEEATATETAAIVSGAVSAASRAKLGQAIKDNKVVIFGLAAIILFLWYKRKK